MSKRLSIITVCYNERNVESTCLSIINQAWQDFEWIVIDGGSDFWCTDILEKYRDNMAFYVSEKDNGIYNAMNKGISKASGKYILFMNAGDSFLNAKTLEKVSTYFHKNADVFYGDAVFKISDGQYMHKILPEKIENSFFIEDCLAHQATYIKTTLFKIYGNYNEKYKIVSDLEKWIQFMQAGCSFEHLSFLCAIFSNDGISSKMDEKHLTERSKMLKTHFSSAVLKNTLATTYPNQYTNPYAQSTIANFINITEEENTPLQPDISVIVPIFNTALYLENCLNSLLLQSHENLEIICINDASYDNSLDILMEYAKKDKRIKIYSFEENVGVATCRNLGLAKASGEYISFVDSDDWVALDFFEKLFEKAKCGDYDLVKGEIYLTFDDTPHALSQCNAQISVALQQNKFIATVNREFTAHLYRHAFLQNAHAEFPNLLGGEGRVFLLSVLLHDPTFSLVEDTYYYYRQHQNSAQHSYSLLNILSYLDHFEMQCTLLDKAEISQADYMEFYCCCIYEEMLFYYKKAIFFHTNIHDYAFSLQRICNIMKKCKYFEELLAYCAYPTLRRLIANDAPNHAPNHSKNHSKDHSKSHSVIESDIPLLHKEMYSIQRNFKLSCFKFWLRYRLSTGEKKYHYLQKFQICKRIIHFEHRLTLNTEGICNRK